MNIDQMITRLKLLKKQEGNVPVYIDGVCDSQLTEVDGIDVYAKFNENGDSLGISVQVY